MKEIEVQKENQKEKFSIINGGYYIEKKKE